MTPQSWQKSSHSGPETNCVELANTRNAVRDSKSHAVLPLSHRAVTGLLRVVRTSGH